MSRSLVTLTTRFLRKKGVRHLRDIWILICYVQCVITGLFGWRQLVTRYNSIKIGRSIFGEPQSQFGRYSTRIPEEHQEEVSYIVRHQKNLFLTVASPARCEGNSSENRKSVKFLDLWVVRKLPYCKISRSYADKSRVILESVHIHGLGKTWKVKILWRRGRWKSYYHQLSLIQQLLTLILVMWVLQTRVPQQLTSSSIWWLTSPDC